MTLSSHFTVMAAAPSYFLLVLPRSKQVQGPAKEVDHSEVVSAWMGTPVAVVAAGINSSESMVNSGRVCGLFGHLCCSFPRCQGSGLVEKCLQ